MESTGKVDNKINMESTGKIDNKIDMDSTGKIDNKIDMDSTGKIDRKIDMDYNGLLTATKSFIYKMLDMSRSNFSEICKSIQYHYSSDIAESVIKRFISDNINIISQLGPRSIPIDKNELVNLATDRYFKLHMDSIMAILRMIEVDNLRNVEKFINKLEKHEIFTYMSRYRDINFIINIIGFNKLILMIDNKEDIDQLIKYNKYLLRLTFLQLPPNHSIKYYILKESIRIFLQGNPCHDIQEIVLECVGAIISNKSFNKISKIFWISEELIYNGNIYGAFGCPVISLVYHLVKYKSFREQYYKFRTLSNIYPYGIFNYNLGIIAGFLGEIRSISNKLTDVKPDSENIVIRSINNIKKAVDDKIVPEDDDLTISIHISLLNKSGYKLILITYTTIKSANLIKNVDPETLRNIEYLLANEECSICLNKTTDLLIPQQDNNTHNCSTVYCNNCLKQLGNNCTVCKKEFTSK